MQTVFEVGQLYPLGVSPAKQLYHLHKLWASMIRVSKIWWMIDQIDDLVMKGCITDHSRK